MFAFGGGFEKAVRQRQPLCLISSFRPSGGGTARKNAHERQ